MPVSEEKVNAYLNGRWAEQRAYYSKNSAKYKSRHQNLLLFGSLSALLVPILLNINGVPALVPTVLSLLVSAALALDNVYRFGDNWRAYRSTLEAMKEERILFENNVAPYDDPETAFPLFVRHSENIMRKEHAGYFKDVREKSEKGV